MFIIDNFLREDKFYILSEEIKRTDEYKSLYFREVKDEVWFKTRSFIFDRLKEIGLYQEDFEERVNHNQFRPSGCDMASNRHCDNGGYVFYLHSDWDDSWGGELEIDNKLISPKSNRFVWISPKTYHRVIPIGLNAEHPRVANISFLNTELDKPQDIGYSNFVDSTEPTWE